MQLHKISTLVGMTILTRSENEAFVKENDVGFVITMLNPQKPISINFPKFYPNTDTIMDELKGQEIEIECEIF